MLLAKNFRAECWPLIAIQSSFLAHQLRQKSASTPQFAIYVVVQSGIDCKQVQPSEIQVQSRSRARVQMPAKKKSRAASRGSQQPSDSRGTRGVKRSRAAGSDSAATRNGGPRSAPSRSKNDLWIAPKTSLTRHDDEVASWSLHSRAPRDARLLELADVALGLRKPEPFRKRKSLFLSAHNGKRSNP